jgi:hypothetical protein
VSVYWVSIFLSFSVCLCLFVCVCVRVRESEKDDLEIKLNDFSSVFLEKLKYNLGLILTKVIHQSKNFLT